MSKPGFAVLWCVGISLTLNSGCGRVPVGIHDVVWTDDVEYVRRGENQILRLDIARPKDADGPLPLVVWIHGGGWVIGNKSLMRPMCEFTASLGYVSATVQYRLIKQGGRFPAPVHDIVSAVRYLQTNASSLGIDPSRMVIGGESAGGHLALMAGLCKSPDINGLAASDESLSVAGIIDIYGPTDLAPNRDKPRGWVKKLVCDFVGCESNEDPKRYAAASPVTHIQADSPPILIIHGDEDDIVRFSQAEALADACRKRGARFELGRVKAGRHGWVSDARGAVCTCTLPLIANFLGRVLH